MNLNHDEWPESGPVPRLQDPGEVPELMAEDSALFALLRGITSSAGPECFAIIARSLAEVLGVRYAIVAEFIEATHTARSLAFWTGSGFAEAIEWPLQGTPCQAVVGGGQFIHHPSGLQEAFPEDVALVQLGAVSYLGVPCVTADRRVLGHLFVMDTRPMPRVARNLALVRVFAARAAAELIRLRLEKTLEENEERLRDLFDEAPIAYVHEGVDTRFIRANCAAMRILGITPDQVQGTYGSSFVPDTPEAQQRLHDAFESVGRGTDTSGVVLELRRKDNGKPVWIQWWSKPDPSGSYTRTMFVDITERVLMEREQARLQAHNRYLQEEIQSAHNFEEIVGNSAALKQVLANVQRVAATDACVLITGETGTGKELIARAVHSASRRYDKPLVKLNCAALPASLVESELFGHEMGAFSGAIARRIGRFELAHNGSLFLDEIGELPTEVQVKLLRVLQEGEFERVGGSETLKVNVRVIAASNRDLPAEVDEGRFRSDLFYRLNVFPIRVPPLRERAADIPLLVAFFVTRLAASVGKRIDSIDPATLDLLTHYSWPGNIRELRNTLERALILTEGSELRIAAHELGSTARAIQSVVRPSAMGDATNGMGKTLVDVEREHIQAVLRQTRGAIGGAGGAAKILGMPASTLRSRMQRLGIKP